MPLEGAATPGAGQSASFDGLDLWRGSMAAPVCTPLTTEVDRSGVALDRCAAGTALTFVLDPGGHEVPPGWAEMALDWFEAVVPPPNGPALSPGVRQG